MLRLHRLASKHLPTVMAMECRTELHPWTQAQMARLAEDSQAMAYVASDDGPVVGFAGLFLLEESFHVERLTVARTRRRRGVGKYLFLKLLNLLTPERSVLTLHVPETNADGLAFLKAMTRNLRGAVSICHLIRCPAHLDAPDAVAYHFRRENFDHPVIEAVPDVPTAPVTRRSVRHDRA
jgi:GNAT superfamily N-acetyltransferase